MSPVMFLVSQSGLRKDIYTAGKRQSWDLILGLIPGLRSLPLDYFALPNPRIFYIALHLKLEEALL